MCKQQEEEQEEEDWSYRPDDGPLTWLICKRLSKVRGQLVCFLSGPAVNSHALGFIHTALATTQLAAITLKDIYLFFPAPYVALPRRPHTNGNSEMKLCTRVPTEKKKKSEAGKPQGNPSQDLRHRRKNVTNLHYESFLLFDERHKSWHFGVGFL